MLKKSAGVVLGSSQSSTGTRPPHRLGGAHRRGAPYSSHRAPLRVRLRFWLACGLAGRPFWASCKRIFLLCHTGDYRVPAYAIVPPHPARGWG